MSSRVWVITGCSSGLGFALALYVLSKGDKVVTTVRTRAKFPRELEAAGAIPLLIDFQASDNIVKRAAEDAIRVYGHVDVLVNNAGTLYNGVQPVEEASVDSYRSIFQVNFFSLIAFTQPFIAYFRTRKSGHIINVSSQASTAGFPSGSGYCATKAALNVLSDSLHSELGPYGVRVTALLTGYFPTSIFDGALQPVSKVYTDPDTQGYGILTRAQEECAQRGWVGDPTIFAARVWEIVTGTGLAKEMRIVPDAGRDICRIPLGSDAGVRIVQVLERDLQNAKELEPFWFSTTQAKAKL